MGDRLEARPADEDVLDSALAVVTDPGDGDLVERIGVLAAAGEASPHARGLILVELHAWLDWLEGWLRPRLGADPPDLLVATYASTLVGAAEGAFRYWVRASTTPGPDDDVPTLQVCFATAITHLRTGLGPERAPAAAPAG